MAGIVGERGRVSPGTTLAKKEEHGANGKRWFLFDAEKEPLGRMAVRIANILRGRHRPIYTPHVDTGEFVVVVNAARVRVSGDKENRRYMFYTGHMGNEYFRRIRDMRQRNPRFIVEHAVRCMLPRNRLAAAMMKKLKVYPGPEHGHGAQHPIPVEEIAHGGR
ncbi:MAG: 50S ribosomal protein L13 [Puniceicoccales bacterium]|jgi:large subunit ribosomal protein L13|nr:50S ribosomal protein L13 [Puniceicoccales bacterium]